MTDLDKMWVALEKYQPYADADGHGESWRRMCAERTQKAAANAAIEATAAAWAAAADAAWAAHWSARAVKCIEAALKEREPMPSNIEPVSSDDGHKPKMDKPEPLIHKHEVESPKRQPLTDAQIDALWLAPVSTDAEHREFARAIEAAHGIGGDK